MLSLIRKYEYNELSKIQLNGNIIDLGGSMKSGYHSLIKGTHKFTIANIDKNYGYDMKIDLEKKFNIKSESFDHAIGLNVLEHIYNYRQFMNETHRIIKKGGTCILTSPFFHQIHGCPSDYNRFTDEALKKISEESNFKIIHIKVLGSGIFSAIYQMISGMIPTKFLKYTAQLLLVGLDKIFSKCSTRYKNIQKNYPLGYFIILEKK